MQEQVIIHSPHVLPIKFFILQLLLFGFVLSVTKQSFKFSWVKSLWISASVATVPGVLWVIRAGSPAAMILGFLPILIVAVCIFSRKFIEGMDDSGNVNTAERQRTLEMVQEGKISAEEGAELLDALGRSNAMLGQDKFSRLDMLILAGVAIAVLGFFLPWVHINIRYFSQSQLQQLDKMSAPLYDINKSMHDVYGEGIYQSGYQTGAIGWAVLIVAIIGAVPVFITPKNFLYKISMLQIFLLLLGGALVISLLLRTGSRMGAGLPVCLAGFVLALLACFGKFKKLSA